LDYAAPDYKGEFSTGGSISENTSLFIAGQVKTMQSVIPVPEGDRDIQFSTSLVHRIGVGDKVSANYIYNREFVNDVTNNFYRWFETTMYVPKIVSSTQSVGLNWNHVVSQATFMEMKLSQLNTVENEQVEVIEAGDFSEIYTSFSNWRSTQTPSGHQGNNIANSRGDYATTTTHFSGSITSQVDKRNLLKSGFDFNYYDMAADKKSSMSNEANMLWDKYHVYPYEGALYVQDKMEYEDFIANLGLRYDFYNFNTVYYADRYSPQRNPGYDPADPDAGGVYDVDLAAKTEAKFTSYLQPRLGFSFPISDKTVLHLNYGVFTQRPPFNRIFESRFKTTVFPNFDRMGNAELQPEKTISYDMGIVRVLPLGLYLDLSAYYKNVSNLIQSAQYVDINGNVYDSFDNREYADIVGYQVALDKKSGRIRVNLRYNWESATGQASGALGEVGIVVNYEDPLREDQKRSAEDIYLDYNRLHKFVATVSLKTEKRDGFSMGGMYPLGNVRISANYRYATGRPFTYDDSGKNLRFNKRTPDEHNLKVHIDKMIRVGDAKITAYAEGYNLLNEKVWSYGRTFDEGKDNPYRDRYMEEGVDVLTETFYSPYVTNLEPYLLSNSPRSYRFGLKFDF
ncbi:TonB-dependent receptor plug domain-containing protein, partial [Candidatus Neomarinimicrobiota bacterium]